MTSCDNTRGLCYIIIPVSKTEQKCEGMRDGCSEEEEIDDDETGLCLDIDLSGQCPRLPVYSRQLGSPGLPHWQCQARDGSQLLPAKCGKLVPQPNIAVKR